jgi:hypothetical protein
MDNAAEASNLSSVFRIVILNVVVILLLIILVVVFGWLRGKRKDEATLGDVDWDEEKKKLLALAAEKRAKREIETKAQVDEKASNQEAPEVSPGDDVDVFFKPTDEEK